MDPENSGNGASALNGADAPGAAEIDGNVIPVAAAASGGLENARGGRGGSRGAASARRQPRRLCNSCTATPRQRQHCGGAAAGVGATHPVQVQK